MTPPVASRTMPATSLCCAKATWLNQDSKQKTSAVSEKHVESTWLGLQLLCRNQCQDESTIDNRLRRVFRLPFATVPVPLTGLPP